MLVLSPLEKPINEKMEKGFILPITLLLFLKNTVRKLLLKQGKVFQSQRWKKLWGC